LRIYPKFEELLERGEVIISPEARERRILGDIEEIESRESIEVERDRYLTLKSVVAITGRTQKLLMGRLKGDFRSSRRGIKPMKGSKTSTQREAKSSIGSRGPRTPDLGTEGQAQWQRPLSCNQEPQKGGGGSQGGPGTKNPLKGG